MGEYKLKGIISEIKAEDDKYQLKLTGTNEYFVKYDKEEYNLFIPPKAPKNLEEAILIKKNYEFSYDITPDNNFLIALLTTCYVNNKPIEVIIKETTTTGSKPKTSYTIKSITALSNL